MEDMGYKVKDHGPVEAMSDNKNRIRYPSLYLDEKAPESLKNKEIGQMCRIEAIVKIVGKRITDGPDGKRQTVDLEIHKLGYKSSAGKKTKKEYLEMDDKGKEDYDKEDLGIEEEKEEE